MEDSALDSLLVNMMQFNRLISQHELLYEKMQFLRKFLKDSDEGNRNEHKEVKDVVTRIGYVTCKVEDILDLFHLANDMPELSSLSFFDADRSETEESTSPPGFCFSSSMNNIEVSFDHHVKSVTENIVDLGKKIYDVFRPLIEVIYSIKGCKEEMMHVLLELDLEIEHELSKTYDNSRIDGKMMQLSVMINLQLEWLKSHMIDKEVCHFHSLSREVSHVLMMGLSLRWPADFCVPGGYLLLSHMIEYMVDLTKRIPHAFHHVTKETHSFKRGVMIFFEKELRVKFVDSHMVDVSRLLLHLSEKMVDVAKIIDDDLVKKITRASRGVMEDIKPIKTEICMNINEKGLDLSDLESLVIDNLHHGFGSVIEEIDSIKTEVMEIYDKKTYGFGVPQIGNSSNGAAVRAPKPIVEEEIMVGFNDEKMTIIELLIGEHEKQLKVIPIAGMPGLGKTTLAGKVYNDPFIVDHFPTRAWTYVSQVYQKRDLLLGILCSAFYFKDEISELCNEKLGEELYKRLKGKRYLIVMDDIWNIKAWDDLQIYFPNDNNGSRIMFTSRILDVVVPLHAVPHRLRFLNENESWDLLQQRVFQRESCPPELMKIGKQIAKKCQGLPLAIVVISGLLAKNIRTLEWWSHVARSVSSYIVSDPEQYMDTLTLSYNHLPYHLKACFLYFSAFPEDYEIPVRKLVWLWIAEGFIHQIGEKSLEDVAEDYLMDLIDRSLVLVARRRSTGGIKACRVHDLLHDLCLRKAKEKNFLQQIDWYEEVSSSSCTGNKKLFPSTAAKQRRLCIHSRNFHEISSELFAPHIRSFLYFGSEHNPIPPKDMSFIEQGFNLLRVLDLSTFNLSTFSYMIVQLVFLRYLALRGKELELPYNISKLQDLETLIVSKGGLTYLPTNIWNMPKLRHLCIGGENVIAILQIRYGTCFALNNLQTISQLRPSSECQKVLERTPNLQKLVFCGSFESQNRCFWFPDLDFLNHLKILKLLNRYVPDHHKYNLQGVKFPPNLKELTLSNTALAWEEMSIIGSLPNLESLKLEFQACVGPQWETSDGGFCRLKFLRFYYMNIEQWNASSNHFPVLERLVLHRCRKLKEIPFDFGDIDTLQMIEVSCCSDSAINSARQIQEEQQGIGNDFLKILIINPPDWELTL